VAAYDASVDISIMAGAQRITNKYNDKLIEDYIYEDE